jgi:hypothetical protein
LPICPTEKWLAFSEKFIYFSLGAFIDGIEIAVKQAIEILDINV